MTKLDSLKSILLVDDDEASNFLHGIFINKLGLEVDVNAALNGQEALDFILDKGAASLALPCMVMLDLTCRSWTDGSSWKCSRSVYPKN
jgi:CheY-like chemotaxis protein